MIKITATTINSSMREKPASERLARLDPSVDLSRLINLLSRVNLLDSTQFHSMPTIRFIIKMGEKGVCLSPPGETTPARASCQSGGQSRLLLPQCLRESHRSGR